MSVSNYTVLHVCGVFAVRVKWLCRVDAATAGRKWHMQGAKVRWDYVRGTAIFVNENASISSTHFSGNCRVTKLGLEMGRAARGKRTVVGGGGRWYEVQW